MATKGLYFQKRPSQRNLRVGSIKLIPNAKGQSSPRSHVQHIGGGKYIQGIEKAEYKKQSYVTTFSHF